MRPSSDNYGLGTAPCHAVETADPVAVAAAIVVAEAWRADRGLPPPRGSGAIVVLHAPSVAWCEPLKAAWSSAVTDHPAPRPYQKRRAREEDRYDVVATQPLARSTQLDAEQTRAIQRSIRLGNGVLAVSQDPGLCLPRYLLAAADKRVLLRTPAVGDLHLIAAAVTDGTCPPLGRPPVALSPVHLQLAVRPGQGPGDYVRRVLDLVAAERAKVVDPPQPLGLDGLHGLHDAVAWGKTTARDLRAFAAGDLAWSEVDRGALLSGPPGTGKTTFAKRFATECGVPLIATSYSEWQSAGKEGHSGELMKCLRGKFAEARMRSPCVLFIDELDTVPARSATKRNDDWWTMVVNGLLAEMDGIEGREGVIILGASNFAERVDPAILRSGRLDRVIRITLPDRKAMEAILLDYLSGSLPAADVAIAARRAVGGSGADAERWCRGARRRARQERRPMVPADLLEEIGDGDTRSSERRLRTAYHEAGHAVAVLLRCPAALTMVSIRKNGLSGGATSWTEAAVEGDLPADVAGLLRDLLAGRAAEEVAYGVAGGGCGGPADSDLARATLIATSAELSWGMGEVLLWRGDPDPATLPHMLAMHRDVAARVETRLCAALSEARDLLSQHRRELDALAAAVAEQETLTGDEAARVVAEARHPEAHIIGPRLSPAHDEQPTPGARQ